MASEPPQHMVALASAFETRMRRSEIRRSLKAGETTLAQHITESSLRTARVREVLIWQIGWGSLAVAQTIAFLGSYNPTCGQLSPRQVAIICELAAVPGRQVGTFIQGMRRRDLEQSTRS